MRSKIRQTPSPESGPSLSNPDLDFGDTAFKYRPGGGFGRLGVKMADYIPYMRELRRAVGPDFDLIQEANT